ncbi:MAG TPA: HEAT repeat domain-containing protein, partial [Minicystis sp.]|nr:HEAT repeat domain-containing protein [Minicystis sp.]
VDRTRDAEDATLPAAIVLGALSSVDASRPGDLAWLAHAATAGGPDARRAAVTAAAQIGGPVAMEVLSFALADEEHEVQLAAARGLGHLCATATRTSARDTIPDVPTSSRRPGEILQLVERSGEPDLVAATVRAIGDGLAAREDAPDDDLLYALASFARHAASPVALASVDALAQAEDTHASSMALAAGLEHADDDVVRAAVLKLAGRAHGWERLLPALAHPSPGVRLLAIEALEGRDAREVRAELLRRASVEQHADVRSALELALATRRDGAR